MIDFIDAKDLDERLKKGIEMPLHDFEKQTLEEMVTKGTHNHYLKCPICKRPFRNIGLFLKHYRYPKNQWEFRKMASIVDKMPSVIQRHEMDCLFTDDILWNQTLTEKIWLYVVSKKIIKRLNPLALGFLP